MNYKNTRKVASYLHILVSIYQFFYIYTPLRDWSPAFTIMQFITFPLLVLTGCWLLFGWHFCKDAQKSN